MNIKEREEKRKRQKALRKRQIRRRMMIFGCAAAAAVVVIVLAVTHAGNTAPDRTVIAEEDAAQAETVKDTKVTDAPKKDLSEAIAPKSVGTAAVSNGTDGETAPAAQEAEAAASGALFDENAGNVTPEELPAKVLETAAKIPECYAGELLPAAHADYTDRSADFAVSPGVSCGEDPVEGEKVVYLTLDDGPSANTITALNILDHYDIRATFFVTGLNPDYHYLIKEAYDRGHTIGLHTWSHDYAEVYASPEAYYADLNAIGQAVSEQIGYVPCFIRFPGGAANYISHDYCEGIMTYLTQDVGNYGYQYFDWNASSGDGAEDRNSAQLADAAISYDYYDTIVLLSHDGTGKEVTMEALPFIIEYYLSKGYEFRPVTRSAYPSHHTVEN